MAPFQPDDAHAPSSYPEVGIVFEFDQWKSEANKSKHGIDFPSATALWDDVRRVRLLARQEGDERRELIVGRLDGRVWTAVVTERSGRVRIISVRRARRSEVQRYEKCV